MKKLARSFYARDTKIVAQELLGKYLVYLDKNKKRIGKIVETEAYLGSHDLAAHSSKGKTPRTTIMFGPAGFAYVYLIYGLYYCVNAVTENEEQGSAVLIRALEPIQDIEQRTQGPGLVCKAMHITKSLNGHDLLSDNFYIASATKNEKITIISAPRVGVAYAKEWAEKPLRFYIKDNPFVSRK